MFIGATGAADQCAAGHQNDLSPMVLNKGALFLIRGEHGVQRLIRAGCELICVGSTGKATIAGGGFRRGLTDEFASHYPVKPHASLSNIHGFRDPEAV